MCYCGLRGTNLEVIRREEIKNAVKIGDYERLMHLTAGTSVENALGNVLAGIYSVETREEAKSRLKEIGSPSALRILEDHK